MVNVSPLHHSIIGYCKMTLQCIAFFQEASFLGDIFGRIQSRPWPNFTEIFGIGRKYWHICFYDGFPPNNWKANSVTSTSKILETCIVLTESVEEVEKMVFRLREFEPLSTLNFNSFGVGKLSFVKLSFDVVQLSFGKIWCW